MNKSTIAVLAIASAASMVGVANAVPFGANTLPPGLSNQGGSPPGLSNQGGLPSGLSSQGGGNNPLALLTTPTSTPVSTVPEGGTTLLLLGVGILVFTLFRRHWQQRLG